MSANICNICGANLIYKDGKWVCPACGAYKTEEISNEEVTLLYNAAQKLRLASFDDAEELYRDIIAKYPENSEAHWGLVLSKYGIKYEDDYDGKKLPTCYATSIESVLTDKDYLDAVRLCKDKYQKEYYIEQGKVLEKIRVEWLEKASKEPKYDVFICFKDSDKLNNMERTDDSIEVANLYTHLSSLGYKVFYSRESLRDKIAEKYEPYIYNALNTAAVMIVYGSKIEYFSSVWMRNEWTRYVRRLREGLKIEGSLVIACDGVNPGDLPRPLNQMQVLDARKKTFYGDLEAHIAKIISIARRPKATVERVEISSAIGKKRASIDNQIKTIKVGGGVGKKTPVVIDNTVSVREIGRYEVPALTPDEDTKLKSIAQFLRSGLFDPANKVADEILTKNKYNGQALLAKLLVEYSAKSIDELSDKINYINDFSIIHSVIEYNDKEIGEKIIGIICDKIKIAIQNGDYNKAVSCFKEIAEYNSNNTTTTRLALRNKATELLEANPDESNKIFDLLLSTYSDAATYIPYLHGIVDDCLKVENVSLSKKYNDKIIEIDDGDVKATFNAIYLSVSVCDIKEFVDLIDLYSDFSKLDNAIRHFDAEEIVVCFYTLQQIFFGALQSGKSGETLSKWFDFIVKYEFDTRKDFIEKTLNELTDVKSLQSRAKLFDHVINCIDGTDVDRHIELRLSLADNLRIGGEFYLAEKYYNEVIDIEEGNINALWGILLCKLNANRESDILENINNFTYFSELEIILKYCPDAKTRVDYLAKLSVAVVVKSAKLTDKTNVEKLSKVFDGIIKYYPEEFNDILINYIQKFADNCKNSSVFSLAEKYYALVLSIDNMRHSAYWGLLQAKLNCRNNDDLIKQSKIITEFTEFSSAIAASDGDERSSERYCQIAKKQLDYIEKQKTVAKQKKKRKSFIKKITAAVAVMVAIVIGVFAFVGYRKSESVLKFSSNLTGVSVYAGKYYNSAIVEIPASNDNKQVTEIADNAFSDKNNIKKVVLPSTITKIGNNAFSGATALETINIPDDVTYIGNSAFKGCKSLRTITIPEKTTKIGSEAFSGCENLTEIIIVAREGGIDGFAEDWEKGIPSSTIMKMGFVINLEYNGATSDDSIKKTVISLNDDYQLPVPKKKGYSFLGWFDSSDGGRKLTDENGLSLEKYGEEKSITVYARWKANLNVVIFEPNGGTGLMENQTIATDEKANLHECLFTRKGYVFIGWGTTSVQKIYADKAEYLMGANESYRLYAIWQANENILHFDANGGNGKMPDVKIKTDETKKIETCSFTRVGYKFDGWATTASGDKLYADGDYFKMGADSEYTLFAVWSPIKYTITYDLNGGKLAPESLVDYTIETKTFTLITPTKEGYTFKGWSGTNLTEKVLNVTIKSGTIGNLAFVANWEANLNTIRFNANGGNGTMPDVKGRTDETIQLPLNQFTVIGCEFMGWAKTSDGDVLYNDGGEYKVGTSEICNLYAVWNIEKYDITYELNGGTASGLIARYTVLNDTFSLPQPTKEGYTFIGWSGTDISGKSKNVTITKGSTGNRSYVANFEANTNTLRFNGNGGIGVMADIKVKTDETVTLPKVEYLRNGYAFKGWAESFDGKVIYQNFQQYKMGTKSLYNLYAIWEANTNKLVFNGNDSNSGEMNEISLKTDEFISLPDCSFLKIGYSFKGWATESNGSVKYENKATYTMGVDSLYTLYAVWEANKYTITLELNGGTASKNKITQDYNSVVDSPILTRSGYNFVEWYADSDFSTVYNFSTMPAENITVYAKWQMKTTGNELTGIRTYDEFKEIKNYSNGNFYLEKNITLDSTWQTIETFSGMLDGGNKTIEYTNETANDENYSLFNKNTGEIKNLVISIKILYQIDGSKYIVEQENYGFLAVYNSGRVHDIVLNGGIEFRFEPIWCNNDEKVNYYIGACIGVNEGEIYKVTSGADIKYYAFYKRETKPLYNYVFTYIGGICGVSKNINDCSVNCSIYALVDKGYYEYTGAYWLQVIIGGVVADCENADKVSFKGEIRSDYTICGGVVGVLRKKLENSFAKIYANNKTLYDGGLVGEAINAMINNSYSICKFNGGNYSSNFSKCAGLVGKLDKSIISNSFTYVSEVNSEKRFWYTVGGNDRTNVINCEYYKEKPDYYEVINRLGWDMDIWILGYGIPTINNGKYHKIIYDNVPADVINYNPTAYKPDSGDVVLNNLQRDGYTFGGWYSDSNYKTKVEKVVNITEPLTLYAKWVPKNYTVTLNTVGGEVLKNTATVTYDSDYTLEVPTRLGYTFLGWYDGTGNSAVAYTDETGKSLSNWTLTEGKTLYAKWKAIV